MESTDLNQKYEALRAQQFLRAGFHWLRDLDKKSIESLAHRVVAVLDEGRAALAPVDRWRSTGLLATLTPIDDIELAFTLWLDGKSGAFRRLLNDYGHEAVFAFIGLTAPGKLSLDSLARLSDFLAMSLDLKASHYRALADRYMRQTRGLRDGPAVAAEKKRTRRQDDVARARQMATDYKRAHPSAGVTVITRYLRQTGQFPKWKADSTYERAIQGVAGAALRDLETSLHR